MSTTKPYKKHLFERLQTHEEMIGYLLAAHAEGSDVFALAVKDVAASARGAERLRIEKVIQGIVFSAVPSKESFVTRVLTAIAADPQEKQNQV